MLKIAPFALGLLTAISIAPSAQAFTPNAQPLTQSTNNRHAQIQVIIGGGHPEYRGHRDYRRDYYHRREQERLRREYYSRRNRSHREYRVPVIIESRENYGDGHYNRNRRGY